MMDAFVRRKIRSAALDAGYDAEWAHELLREEMSIRSIIPPRIGPRGELLGAMPRDHAEDPDAQHHDHQASLKRFSTEHACPYLPK